MRFGLKESTIDQINSVFAQYPQVESAILYGSRAKGNYRPGSDIDLTLIGDAVDLSLIHKIEIALDDLLLPYTIELSAYHHINNPDLIDHIERVGILFYRAASPESGEGSVEVMSEWREITLGNFVEIGSSTRIFLKEYVEQGVPFYRSKEIIEKEEGTEIATELFISHERYDEIKKQYGVPIKGDILLSAVGHRSGIPYLVRNEGDFYFKDGNLIWLKKFDSQLSSTFLYYWLKSNIGQISLESVMIGSAQKALTISGVKTLRINLPSLDEQRRIAAVLSTLDAKIDLLRRQNQTLEQIAQTLFKRWFVEFEFPTLVNSEKLKVNSEELFTHHSSLFTGYKSCGGAMVESELGEIPQGWRVGTLGEVAKNIRLTVNPNDVVADTPYIGLEHMPRRKVALDTWGLAENIESSKFQFKKGQILFGKLRPYFHKVGVAFTDGICSTDILVLSPKKYAFFGFVLMTVSSVEFVKYVSSASEGTRMPRTNWQYMSDYVVAIPDQNTSKKFSDLISSFVSKMEINTAQIRTLARLRDTLLPKLMSGQLRVNSG